MTNLAVRDQYPDYDTLVDQTLNTLSSVHSKRVYANIYRKWYDWTQEWQLHPLAFQGQNVVEYLKSLPYTRNTREQHFAAIRKMVQYLAIYDSRFRIFFEELKLVKCPVEGVSTNERNKVALTPVQVRQVQNFFSGDDPLSIRNKALVCTAIATGARRSELVNMEWRDFNEEGRTIIIRHGKGDRERVAAIVGNSAVNALRQWRDITGAQWHYIFVPVNKSGKIAADEPIDDTTYYKTLKKMSQALGFDFATHDLRRTLATLLLAEGGDGVLKDVQLQLGHERISTTEKYLVAGDAVRRGKRLNDLWSE